MQKAGQDYNLTRSVVKPVILKGDVKLLNLAEIQGGRQFILSHVGVIVNGVLIGHSIY